MGTELWVKNGLVFTGEGFQQTDIKIRNQKIDRLIDKHPEFLPEKQPNVIDAGACLVVPGFIDAHVHFNQPGRTEWEGVVTGSRAAAIGGTTTFFDMPLNSSPPVTSLNSLLEKKASLASQSYIDYALWGGMTGHVLSTGDFTKMEHGIIGWKAFMVDSGMEDFEKVSAQGLIQAMTVAKEQNKILAIHAEWEDEVSRLTAFYKESPLNDRTAYLNSRPVSSEVKAVQYALDAAAKYGTRLHFVHISSVKSVELIQQAKKSGVNATVETCPHYLIFDDHDFIKIGPLLKCAPPLRSRDQVESMWDCVARGWIDTIGSDHSPCLSSMKSAGSIWDSWGGIQGVQFTWLALLDQAMKRKVSLAKVLPLGSSNVAKRFEIAGRKGTISPGQDADLVLISLDEQTYVDKSSIAFRNQFSPYENFIFQLKIKKTILRGHVIFDDEKGMSQEKLGQCIL